jgi:hypothetical protein
VIETAFGSVIQLAAEKVSQWAKQRAPWKVLMTVSMRVQKCFGDTVSVTNASSAPFTQIPTKSPTTKAPTVSPSSTEPTQAPFQSASVAPTSARHNWPYSSTFTVNWCFTDVGSSHSKLASFAGTHT